ncbi:indole-2-monooxygenase-like [Triticum dicoccoides]|uniref:indole-2-monooxygenase-like n=1 Tax=Triticum dicoccoides TaxID=85692 RepID=UPI000E7C4A52|nr:indole-2-monooxygenase-like [Triticum dicoccoides]
MAGLVMLEMLPRAWFLYLFPLFLLFLHYYCFTVNGKTGKGQQRESRLPPSPPALPIVGHLHLVGCRPHASLRDLAARHGRDGLMLLRLGAVPTLVVSSPRAAEAVLRTHDHIFASRPRSMVPDIILYGSSDVAFTPYGEHWRQAKKLLTNHVLSVKKVESLRTVAMEQVSMAMAKINEAAAVGGVMDMSKLLKSFTCDIACRIVSGEYFLKEGRSKLFQELTSETSHLLGGFNMEKFYPTLARVGVGLLKRNTSANAERVKNRWDDMLDKVIDDHDSKDKSMFDYNCGNFIDILLSIQMEYGLTREHMKALLIDVFFGSIETMSNTLEFTLAEIVRSPRLIGKLQDEVRSIVPKGQELVSEADINKMAYLRAVIKESLRLHPVVPLLAPHLAMADCNIDGYMVLANTHVLINVWAIGRDSSCWEDAEEFIPERFIDEGSDVGVNFKGNDFQLLPFGAGRRMCPGINLGITAVELMLANLMHHFDWELPLGVERKDINMTEVFGLTVCRMEKLLLVPKSCM